MEARVRGSQDKGRPTPAPHAEPGLGPLGAPARSASLPSPSRELSNLVRSQTIRASAGRCVGWGRLEQSAAFRHSEPGLNGARGFPRGPGAGARARWRCLVSARRVVGSVTLPGSQPHPIPSHWFFTHPLETGMLREGAPQRARGLPGWASECVLRPWGAASGVARQNPLLLAPDGTWGPGAPGPGAAWGRWWATSEVSGGWR